MDEYFALGPAPETFDCSVDAFFFLPKSSRGVECGDIRGVGSGLPFCRGLVAAVPEIDVVPDSGAEMIVLPITCEDVSGDLVSEGLVLCEELACSAASPVDAVIRLGWLIVSNLPLEELEDMLGVFVFWSQPSIL